MRRELVIALALALAACGSEPAQQQQPAPQAPARPRGSFVADSTIAARDYVGPARCGECHGDEHARWSQSLHSVMNQRAETGGAVIGDFAATLPYRGGEARFARDGEAYTMTLARGASSVRYRITRTIGVRGLQEYVGVADGTTEEVRLPFAWWPRRAGWYPQPYYDSWLAEDDLDPYTQVREPWATRCPWCHSTYPFAQRIARSAARGLGHGLDRYYTAHDDGSRVGQQVTVGISCESCHLGGRAHADGAAIHFVPIGAAPRASAPRPTTFTEERRDATIVNAVCAQCHSGPSPRFPDGGATRNSSEALDLAAGPCTNLRCTDCHDPHRGGGDEARAVAACTRCHRALADPAAARTHAGHDSATCLDCHMPRIVMGIDRYIRTHRISTPSDRAMLAAAAPNACNLCHLDRSIRWTVDELATRFDAPRDPRGWAYRDLDTAVGELWLASPQPAIRLVATAAYARSPLGRYALEDLLRGLDDPLPHVRTWTTFAIEDILRKKLRDADYDPRAPSDRRRAQIAKLAR